MRQDLAKVEQLETKIRTELTDLNTKIETMTNELVTYRDTDRQRSEAEAMKKVRV